LRPSLKVKTNISYSSVKISVFFLIELNCNSYQRNHLTEFLRTRSSSSIGSSNSISEDVREEVQDALAADADEGVESQDSELSRSRLTSLDKNNGSSLSENQQTSSPNKQVQCF